MGAGSKGPAPHYVKPSPALLWLDHRPPPMPFSQWRFISRQAEHVAVVELRLGKPFPENMDGQEDLPNLALGQRNDP